ncbi:hypothetical protein PybrP1_002934 [[Pythium] brassicae (nom. inval.)]|nr:hypothetical protein PybrP1_002934 [[Pythium] brassicae (nom. inval.)]
MVAPPSALYMTPSPSELSIFGEAEEELDEALALAEAEAEVGRAPQAPDALAERRKLTRELLDALYLGASNFLLAYNTRAGIAVLLRVFRLLLQRKFRAVVDLRQLLDEKHVTFRVDAVSFGLFLGWFTGGYRALRALLPVLLKRYAARKQQQNGLAQTPQDAEQQHRREEQLSALASGALAGCAIVFVDAKKRRSFALYALTRALQCAYNTAKRNDYWHFWGSDWRFGDVLLFAVSSAQVMYAYVMRPSTLPPEYFRFIQNTGPVELETLSLVQQSNRGVPIDQKLLERLIARKNVRVHFPLPEGVGVGAVIPCGLVHCEAASCTGGALRAFRRAFTKTFPLYLSLFIVPSVVIHFKKFLSHPLSTLSRAVLGATRSNSFLASFVTAYLALICTHRKLFKGDHRIVALFSASMSVMMYCYEHEKESVSPFLFSVMKRFLATATDKKRAYLATLRQQNETRQLQVASAAQA